MFSLTPRERILLVFVLGATLLGAAIKHARETRREHLAAGAAAAARQEALTQTAKPRAPRSPGRAKTPPPADIALAEEPGDR